MKTIIITLIFIAYLYSSVQALSCSTNPCDLGPSFNDTNGYRCLDVNGDALCTCPGSGYEINERCRLCNRKYSVNNVCRNTTGKLLACLEDNDCGTSYACLCMDTSTGGATLTTNADCDTTGPLTCSPTTNPSGPSPCLNSGVFVNNICHCPSGYSGAVCQDKNDYNLCQRIMCKSRGVCAIQNPKGPYEAVCLCRYGTWGEYCELNGTLGYCSASSCMNGGACRENVVGATRHAYCQCELGYNGTRCENRYFTCARAGKFADTDMRDQARYFECLTVGGSLRAERRMCPRGLRFNETSQLCTF